MDPVTSTYRHLLVPYTPSEDATQRKEQEAIYGDNFSDPFDQVRVVMCVKHRIEQPGVNPHCGATSALYAAVCNKKNELDTIIKTTTH